MNDIKFVVAKNISELRLDANMTQLELADKLNYSDKAVSKWERGESMPDVAVLLEIADIFGVTLDYLVHEEHSKAEVADLKKNSSRFTFTIITAVAVISVWFVAVLTFVIISLIWQDTPQVWLSFVCAIPVSSIVWLILNSIWFNRRRNYLIISIIMWSVLLLLHLSLLPFSHNMWLIYIIGIPAQIIILLCWILALKRKPKNQ